MLETLEFAVKRGAKIYGEICGFCVTNDGYNYIKGDESGEQYARAVRLAVGKNQNPDYVSLNGTATETEDNSEINGLHIAFKEEFNKITYSCPKAFLGNTYGASSAIDIIISCLSMKNSLIVKTGNVKSVAYKNEFPLVIGQNNRGKTINSFLQMSKGLGGINSALYIKRL